MGLLDLLFVAGLAISVPTGPNEKVADQSTFRFDRQLALDLGGAYARSLSREMQGRSELKLDFSSPEVVARTFKNNRHLVMVAS